MALFCAGTVVILVVRDLALPEVRDTEVWFGLELRGPLARATAPLHWAIFALGAAISVVVMAYVAAVVPRVSAMVGQAERPRRTSPTKSLIASAVRDSEFMRTLVLIGLDARAGRTWRLSGPGAD